MSENIIVALITLGGSGLGSLVGIIVSSRLTAYRLEQLEKKVSVHNNLIERTYKIEERLSLNEKDIDVVFGKISEIGEKVRC